MTSSVYSSSSYLSNASFFTQIEEKPAHIFVDKALSEGVDNYDFSYILERIAKYFLNDKYEFLINFFKSLKRKDENYNNYEFLNSIKYQLCFITTILDLYYSEIINLETVKKIITNSNIIWDYAEIFDCYDKELYSEYVNYFIINNKEKYLKNIKDNLHNEGKTDRDKQLSLKSNYGKLNQKVEKEYIFNKFFNDTKEQDKKDIDNDSAEINTNSVNIDNNITNKNTSKMENIQQNSNKDINKTNEKKISLENIVNNLQNKINNENEHIIDNTFCSSENVENKRKVKNKINQEDEIKKVLNKIKKHYKKIYNNESIYEQLLKENKKVIETLSIIHQKYSIEKEIDDDFISKIYKLYDTNKARFIKNIEIFYNLYNEKILYNSNFLFLRFTFNNINKESINNLINTLKINLLE